MNARRIHVELSRSEQNEPGRLVTPTNGRARKIRTFNDITAAPDPIAYSTWVHSHVGPAAGIAPLEFPRRSRMAVIFDSARFVEVQQRRARIAEALTPPAQRPADASVPAAIDEPAAIAESRRQFRSIRKDIRPRTRGGR